VPLSNSQEKKIEEMLENKMNEKITRYKRETVSMPFLTRLVQDDQAVASFSFMISLATTLGQSIYEKVAQIVAEENCQESSCGVKLGGIISPKRNAIISQIVNELRQVKRN
jgi:hypothetical protein